MALWTKPCICGTVKEEGRLHSPAVLFLVCFIMFEKSFTCIAELCLLKGWFTLKWYFAQSFPFPEHQFCGLRFWWYTLIQAIILVFHGWKEFISSGKLPYLCTSKHKYMYNSKIVQQQALFVLKFCHSLIFFCLCCLSEVACAHAVVSCWLHKVCECTWIFFTKIWWNVALLGLLSLFFRTFGHQQYVCLVLFIYDGIHGNYRLPMGGVLCLQDTSEQ